MKYDFTTVTSRKNTGCIKWDHLAKSCADDAIPTWVADMDFVCAPEIVEALGERAAHPIYGYTKMDEAQYQSIIDWVGSRHGYTLQREWIVPSAGVVCSLNAMVDELLKDGGKVLMCTPCYSPFFSAASGGGHEREESPLAVDGIKYTMDFEDIGRRMQNGVKAMILCNPHNPVGRSWTYDELYALGELCEKYDVYVISDDIHCDIILPGKKYVPAITVPTLKDRTSVLISATKTFNLAGLQASTAIIPDASLRKGVSDRLFRYGHSAPNIFGMAAQYTAYTHCAPWLDELTQVINENMDYMLSVLVKTPLRTIKPDATYLLWVDCSALGLQGSEIFDFFIEKANICPNWGKTFGDENFIRLNLAAPRALIEEIGERILGAFIEQ